MNPLISRRFQRGAAAVEFAILATVMLTLLTVPLFFARCFWHYTAIQKAAHDATWYLATIPKNDMKNIAKAVDAAKVASYIASAEVADLSPGGYYVPVVTVDCRPGGCGTGTPTSVYVRVTVNMFDPIFHVSYVGSEEGLRLTAESEMNYVGP
jgi:Flp pilus assembly protein TadG